MVTLLRWFLPQVLLYGLIALFNALLNARRAFGAAAFAPAINNVVVTAMFLVLPSLTKGDLRGVSALDVVRSEPRVLFVLGAGTTLGVAVNAAVLVPALVGRRLHLRVNFDLRNPTVHRLIKLSTWTVSYAVTNQVANFVVLPIANRGNASAYLYAYLIFIVPHGLLAASLLTTITPELSRQAHAQDWGSLRRSWTGGLRATGLLVLPAAAGLTAIAYPLVRVVPVWSTDTKTSVASVLIWYAPGLFSYSVYLLALRPFYARGDTRTPFRVNLVQNAVHIVVAVILGFRFGVQGLAATHTIAYSVGAVLAFGSAAKSLGRVPISEVAPIAGMAGAAIAMGTVVAAVLALVNLGNGEVPLVLQLVLAVVLGAALYPAYLRAFRADRDLQPVMHRLAARFGLR